MNNGEAHLLTTTQFDLYWPAISKDMDNIKGSWEIWWTKDALYQAVMSGWMNVWAIGSADAIHLVAFTQIINYPANRNLRVVLLLGNHLDEYYDMAEAVIEKFALDNGCVYIEANGRHGWRRRLKGVECHGVVLTRKLSTTRVQ